MNGPVASLPSVLRSAGLLGLVAVLGTALLAGVNALTHDRIAEQERLVVMRQLAQVLPAHLYDNALHDDFIEITEPGHFRGKGHVRIHRARLEGREVGVIFNLVAPDGYNGDIRLLVGVFPNGAVSGVRVIAHRETPGLGDPIERERSDWILGFDGRSLDNPGPEGWAVRRDGGVFDQFTGATITPRAVVEAVQRVLEYHESHAETLFRKPPGAASAEGGEA
ncbi:MAG: electron transport complex subunit RsxG [Xanthomonadales bacterium]|nr:electron transport complex subunit RsxG [Xanthomonadales bacterium]NIX12892.1 electron transport complex subunit RsxG [Xanthomonadales bacterium]